ncbi:MAG: hypothetical protein J7497_02920 [Chitinophagaceae bacterium]|nr:hypothetical protein [Chitinophagaceae bacterium]
MRKTALLVAFIVAVAGLSSCRKNMPAKSGHPTIEDPAVEVIETKPAILTAVRQNVSTYIKGYYEAIPARYNETEKKYPLILFFHGGGQYGDGVTYPDTVLREGIPKLLAENKFPPSFTVNGKTFSFIVIAPQFVRMPSTADVDAMLAVAKSKYRIDTTRIYLSGFSLGAQSMSYYASYNPTAIAAMTSMGGLLTIDDELDNRCQALVKAKLPIWHFHNKDDGAWPYSEAVTYIDKLNSFSPVIPPKFTSFDVGEAKLHHDCWTRTMDPAYRENNQNIYEWMLSYTR